LSLLAFLLVRSASASFSGVRYFSSTSAKAGAFLLLGVKLFVRRVSHTGITMCILGLVSGHGNLQH
jgi:hypothetical protein